MHKWPIGTKLISKNAMNIIEIIGYNYTTDSLTQRLVCSYKVKILMSKSGYTMGELTKFSQGYIEGKHEGDNINYWHELTALEGLLYG